MLIRSLLLAALLTLPALAQKVTLVAGDPATKLASPFGVEHDKLGRLVIVEYASALRVLDKDGKLITLAGDGTKGDSGDNGPADKARLNAPHAIAIDRDGAIYIADTLNHKVRRIDAASAVITTFAGTTKGYSGDDGPAAKAQFSGIYCISLNPDKSKMLVTDLDNKRIRMIDMKSQVVTLVAGNGAKGIPTDGALAIQAPLVDPRAAAMDSRGNVYILERGGHALRIVTPDGRIKTLLPPGTIKGPKHLVIDPNDNPIITDTDNHRIIKWIAADAKFVVLAGTGTKGNAGIGGPPDKLQLNQPHGVYLDKQGALYISDSMNHRVLKIDP